MQKEKIKKALWAKILIFSFPLTLFISFPWPANSMAASFFQSYNKLKSIPEFSLYDLQGKLINIKDYVGKVMLLNFWSTWCPNCQKETRFLEELYSRYEKTNLKIFRINAKESSEIIRNFLQKNPSKITILLDEKDKVGRLMGVWVHPTSYLVDRQGKIRYRAMGLIDWTNSEVIAIIDQLLKEDGK